MTATVWSECAQTVEGECADMYQTKNVCEPANVIVSTVASMLMFLLDCKHLMFTPQQVIHNFKTGYNNWKGLYLQQTSKASAGQKIYWT